MIVKAFASGSYTDLFAGGIRRHRCEGDCEVPPRLLSLQSEKS